MHDMPMIRTRTDRYLLSCTLSKDKTKDCQILLYLNRLLSLFSLNGYTNTAAFLPHYLPHLNHSGIFPFSIFAKWHFPFPLLNTTSTFPSSRSNPAPFWLILFPLFSDYPSHGLSIFFLLFYSIQHS